MLTATLVTLLLLLLAVGWVLNILSLPGNWLMIAAAALYYLFISDDSAYTFGLPVLLAMLALAVIAEIVESLAGAAGAARLGGSKRGAALAIVGSLIGAPVGAVIGVPIPLIGSVVGAILFAAVGAMIGAVLGDLWKGRDLDTSLEVGAAAFQGRLIGTVVKIALGTAIALLPALALFV